MATRKQPLRTYQRKTTKKSSTDVLLVPSITMTEKSHFEYDHFRKSRISDDSFSHDPFETTFDRIAKGAVVPPLPLNMSQSNSWNISSSFENDNNLTNHVKSPKHRSDLLTCNSVSSLMQKNVKLNHKGRRKNEHKLEINISAGTVPKKAKLKSQRNIVQSVKKRQVRKRKVYKSQTKKEIKCKFEKSSHICNGQLNPFNTSSNLENAACKNDILYNNISKGLHRNIFKTDESDTVTSPKTSDQAENCLATYRYRIDYHQIIKPCFVKLDRYTLQNGSSSHQIKTPMEALNKACSVVLVDNVKNLDASENKKESVGDASTEARENGTNVSFSAFKLNSHETISRNISVGDMMSGTKDKEYQIKKSFVKITKLDEQKLMKERNRIVDKRERHMISSTPIGKCLRPSSIYPMVLLSPINTNIFSAPDSKKITVKRDNSITKCCARSSVMLDIQEQLTHILLSQKTDTDSVVKVEVTTPEDEIYLTLTRTYDIENDAEAKYFLNISADTNRSRSLFDDTTQNRNYSTISAIDENHKNMQERHESVEDEGIEFPLNLSVDLSLKRSPKDDVCADVSSKSSKIYTLIKTKIPKDSSNTVKCTEQACESEEKTDAAKTGCQDSWNVVNGSVRHLKSQNEASIIDSVEGDVLNGELQNPIGITKRRARYHPKWYLDESDVAENSQNRPTMSNNVELLENTIQQRCTNEVNLQVERKSIFLKPGKYWARSLSILSNINNESDLKKLSIGKGKKWRQSVMDILDMQRSGIAQSYSKKDQDDMDLSYGMLDASNVLTFGANSCKTLNSTNCRLSKRISVRVVPSQNVSIKYDSKNSQFLKAYGITKTGELNSSSEVSCRKQSSICDVRHNDDHYNIESQITTARDIILQRCSQKDYIPFSKCYPNSFLEHCCKIGEGVYGEVFLYENGVEKSVIKIIPIEGKELVNGEPQKKFSEILSEIVIAEELYNLRFHDMHRTNGFVEVQSIKCIIGKYPQKLIELWNIFDNDKKSDNDCPTMFGKDQLYVVLELGHGGQALEAFVFETAEEAYAIFLQATLALAVAEQALEFEHRDMHWGNVLISKIKEPYIYYNLDGKEIKCPSKGVKVSIIDYTLSRMLYQECCIYNDLALDPALFTAYGEYQFEVYRLMRDRIENNWQKFEPYTNILWLHYILDKMVTTARYKKKTAKIHKQAMNRLKGLRNTILNYNSVYDFVSNNSTCLYEIKV